MQSTDSTGAERANERNAVPAAEMPRYRCHKEVWALKIAEVKLSPLADQHAIVPADEGYAPFTVSDEYVRKHKPQAGGYYVVYDDGYTSYSPAAPFEEGYAPVAAANGEHLSLNVRHPNCHKAADAFWEYWKANGETHRHGYYESTWGAINAALRMVGVMPRKKP